MERERERLQIEHILGLEAENLEVEEVDDDELSDGDDNVGSAGPSVSAGFVYDASLVALHSYLGEVDDTRHRVAFLDGGAVFTLPLFYLEGVVLFPEATLPLRVIFPNFIAGVQRALRQTDAPYTIGVVNMHKDLTNGRIKFSTIGTTAEIRQFRSLEDGSINIVARGQQRFRLQRRWVDVDGALCGEVQIISEDLPTRTPRDAVGKITPLGNSQARFVSMLSNYSSRLYSECEELNDSDGTSVGSFELELSSPERKLHESAIFSSSCSDDENLGLSTPSSRFENSCSPVQIKYSQKSIDSRPGVIKRPETVWKRYCISRLREAPRAFWPPWVYHVYDSYSLARNAADRWKRVVKAPNLDDFLMKPDVLSFNIASRLPLSESSRQELLEIDGTSYRLRREIELLDAFDKLKCRVCL
ncbi:hypothetical protein M569_09748, partial [Genlisea aurea]